MIFGIDAPKIESFLRIIYLAHIIYELKSYVHLIIAIFTIDRPTENMNENVLVFLVMGYGSIHEVTRVITST
jgi:hypothetical protein